MKFEEAKELVASIVSRVLKSEGDVPVDMPLIGGESPLDSLGLVEVCLALEDLAEEHGFEFDWVSEAAMSNSRSMFRSVSALAQEFAVQSEA